MLFDEYKVRDYKKLDSIWNSVLLQTDIYNGSENSENFPFKCLKGLNIIGTKALNLLYSGKPEFGKGEFIFTPNSFYKKLSRYCELVLAKNDNYENYDSYKDFCDTHYPNLEEEALALHLEIFQKFSSEINEMVIYRDIFERFKSLLRKKWLPKIQAHKQKYSLKQYHKKWDWHFDELLVREIKNEKSVPRSGFYASFDTALEGLLENVKNHPRLKQVLMVPQYYWEFHHCAYRDTDLNVLTLSKTGQAQKSYQTQLLEIKQYCEKNCPKELGFWGYVEDFTGIEHKTFERILNGITKSPNQTTISLIEKALAKINSINISA